MDLYEVAVIRKTKDGDYSIVQVQNKQILAPDGATAKLEAARQLPSDIPTNEVRILVRPFA